MPPYQQRIPTPESLHPSQRHMNEVPPAQQHLVPPQAAPPQIGSGMNGASQMSQQDELLFFDKTKKTLEIAGTYEDFLKLIQAFAKEVIDTHALIQLSEPLLSDGDLWHQFKELLGWDDRRGNVEHGPPGSIRTSAPDPQAATCPDDDEGPSYRRLPAHVRSSFWDVWHKHSHKHSVGDQARLLWARSACLGGAQRRVGIAPDMGV